MRSRWQRHSWRPQPRRYLPVGQPTLEVAGADLQQPVRQPVGGELVKVLQFCSQWARGREVGSFWLIPVVAFELADFDNVEGRAGSRLEPGPKRLDIGGLTASRALATCR